MSVTSLITQSWKSFSKTWENASNFGRTQSYRVHMCHGKPGKLWNLIISLGLESHGNLGVGHRKSWKISTLSMSERQ